MTATTFIKREKWSAAFGHKTFSVSEDINQMLNAIFPEDAHKPIQGNPREQRKEKQ